MFVRAGIWERVEGGKKKESDSEMKHLNSRYAKVSIILHSATLSIVKGLSCIYLFDSKGMRSLASSARPSL